MFSFPTIRRKPQPPPRHISSPLSPAEVRHMETSAVDGSSRSPYLARGCFEEQLKSSKLSLNSIGTHDTGSLHSGTASARTECRQKPSEGKEPPATARSLSQHLPNKLRKESSTSTLRSYYDRKKSPLAVSQQTSASSARDFALRKGCPPAITTSNINMPVPATPGALPPAAKKRSPKRRPSRLDFSTVFPRPLPRSGPLLSPQRYTDSPPPLSVTSETPLKEHQSRSFLEANETSGMSKRTIFSRRQALCQPLTTAASSFTKINVQKPPNGTQNWFDGLEGDVSDDDVEREPEMQADFVETAFQPASNKVSPKAPPRADDRGQEGDQSVQLPSYQPSEGNRSSISIKIGFSKEILFPEISRQDEANAKTTTVQKINSTSSSYKNATSTLERANLNEESVLCLSSSDDDDEPIQLQELRRALDRRSFLRDSLGVESIDSEVEIGTAQAVNASILRTFPPLLSSTGVSEVSSTCNKPRVQKLKAIAIPDRSSSKRHAPPCGNQITSSSSDDGIQPSPRIDETGQNSIPKSAGLSSARRQSPLLMVLTPQEAALLEALRLKRASMRQTFVTNPADTAEDGVGLSQPPRGSRPSDCRDTRQVSTDPQPAHLDAGYFEVKKPCLAYHGLAEPSLPSRRVSLIFSEDLSSPTTGRDSPATPGLDTTSDVRVVHRLGDDDDQSTHEAEGKHLGHVGYMAGNTRIMMLDNFPQPRKEGSSCNEHTWAPKGHMEDVNSEMIQ